MASMVQKIAQITLNNQNVSYASSTSIPPRQIMMCDLCGGEHNLGECLNDDMGSQSTMEQVDLVGYGRQQQFQPQGAYNPNVSRNHPGFSWSNPMGAANPQSFGNRGPPPGFQGQQNYRGGQQQQQSRQNLGFQNSNAQPRQPLEKPPPPNWEAMIEMMFKSQMQSEEKIRQVSDKLDQLNTIDSCVRETLEESNWISNNPLGVDVEDTIEEEQIDEDTSGFDELFDENELLVQPSSPKLEVFGLGDQLANHNGDNHPKVELKPLPSELKYAFLGSNSTYPIIVNANLNDDEIENYQMAPKSRIPKRQRRETSQQAQNPPQVQQFETFNTPQARERYDTWVSTRDFKKERGIQLEVPEEWNWKPLLLAQPGDACCSVVKEFYANAGDGLDTNTAIVRGVEVDFSSDAINTYYGTEDYYEDDYYHNDLKMSNLTVEMLNEIVKTFDAEAEWNIRSGLIAHMDYKYFTPRDRAIIDFIKAKLIPNSHRGYVRRDQVLLTYCIKKGYTIDVGVLINQSIREIITMMVEKKSRSTLGHPSLITELCRNAGVPMDNHHEVKLKPQAFITPQYIATHYAQAQRPGDADQQEEDVAMGDPDPMPAQPQFPQQFDMQQFFARQEEFMRRQDNFMRRNDEINWYVGTSTYQHNQAAQGFTPHFPPPPPWLQDPQYIPDYYRPHFPPPPDDADHQ
nr:uncharacterized protein LOC109169324 [Ipomoea batatas]